MSFLIIFGSNNYKKKIICTDHVSAIGKNPGKMAIVYQIFIFLVFLKNLITVLDQRRSGLENTVSHAKFHEDRLKIE